jgi:TonB family protein
MERTKWVFLPILAIAPCWAQPPLSADALVAQIAAFARNGVTWKAEGEIRTRGAEGRQEVEKFRIAYKVTAPFRARLDILSGPNPRVRFCDGAAQWTYYPNHSGYIRVMLPQISPCAYPFNAWPPLPVTLHSPVLDGKDEVKIDNRFVKCQIIRGIYAVSANAANSRTLSMCVDPVSKLILRYQIEDKTTGPSMKTIVFSSIQRDAKLDEDLFRFHPPNGAKEIGTINWLDPRVQPSSGVLRVSDQVTAPLLTNIMPPQLAGDPGSLTGPTVVLYAEVSANGVPQNMKIIRSLGKPLDDRAIEAVKQWRFEPAISDGKTVPVVASIAVRFHSE